MRGYRTIEEGLHDDIMDAMDDWMINEGIDTNSNNLSFGPDTITRDYIIWHITYEGENINLKFDFDNETIERV